MVNIDELSKDQRVRKTGVEGLGMVLYTIPAATLVAMAEETYRTSRKKGREETRQFQLSCARDSVRIQFDNSTLCTLYCSQVEPALKIHEVRAHARIPENAPGEG